MSIIEESIKAMMLTRQVLGILLSRGGHLFTSAQPLEAMATDAMLSISQT